MKRNRFGFIHLHVLLLIAIVLIVVGFVAYRVAHNKPIKTVGNSSHTSQSSSSGCDSRLALFTTSPVSEADLTGITPLGNPNPPAHVFPTDHIYLNLRRAGPPSKPGLLGPPAEVPVYAPGQITIYLITAKQYLTGTPHTDYAIEFSPCRGLQARFDHLASLVPKLAAQIDNKRGDCQTSSPSSGTTIKFCRQNVNVALEAGETMGTAGGPNGSNNLDFRLSDANAAALAYANPSRWQGDSAHVVCPVDYFTSALKDKLDKLFGDAFGQRRTTPPVCGTVAQDIKTTAQGAWFSPGKPTYPENQHIALVPSNIDPAQMVFSIGESLKDIGISPERYVFLPKDSGNINKAFKNVTADGHVYCYETTGNGLPSSSGRGSIILQLISDTTLRIGPGPAKACGREPWSFNAYKDFQR